MGGLSCPQAHRPPSLLLWGGTSSVTITRGWHSTPGDPILGTHGSSEARGRPPTPLALPAALPTLLSLRPAVPRSPGGCAMLRVSEGTRSPTRTQPPVGTRPPTGTQPSARTRTPVALRAQGRWHLTPGGWHKGHQGESPASTGFGEGDPGQGEAKGAPDWTQTPTHRTNRTRAEKGFMRSGRSCSNRCPSSLGDMKGLDLPLLISQI